MSATFATYFARLQASASVVGYTRTRIGAGRRGGWVALNRPAAYMALNEAGRQPGPLLRSAIAYLHALDFALCMWLRIFGISGDSCLKGLS